MEQRHNINLSFLMDRIRPDPMAYYVSAVRLNYIFLTPFRMKTPPPIRLEGLTGMILILKV